MATFSKQFLSASMMGTPLAIGTGATPTFIHQTSGSIDEVWLWGVNIHPTSASSMITVVMGTSGSTPVTASVMPLYGANGLTPILPGIPITTTGSIPTRISATGQLGSTINVVGFVNRIS
jgi:hypothetical protein